MKAGIHPTIQQVSFTCACGASFTALSAMEEKEVRVEVCSKCHPFFTGKQKLMASGRLEAFMARQKKFEAMKEEEEKRAKKEEKKEEKVSAEKEEKKEEAAAKPSAEKEEKVSAEESSAKKEEKEEKPAEKEEGEKK